jgi:hypothetical protein
MEEQEKLINQLKLNRQRLTISRVPQEVKKEFTEFADEQFCSDYGMALKWLWDHYQGTLPSNLNVEDIYARLAALEMRTEETDKEEPRPLTMTGREIKAKRREKNG